MSSASAMSVEAAGPVSEKERRDTGVVMSSSAQLMRSCLEDAFFSI